MTPKGRAPHLDPDRRYRALGPRTTKETAFQVVVEETDLLCVAGRDMSREVRNAVVGLRGLLKTQIELQPEFATSFTPVDVSPRAPEIARRMAAAARLWNVGPMAAVAGTIAQMVAEEVAGQAPEARDDLLVENGGDLFLFSTTARTVGLLWAPEDSVRLGVRVEPREFPVSFCASSGVIGHSVSLGVGDLVVVRSPDASLADAGATALANLIRTGRDLGRVLDAARRMADAGVEGVFAQAQGKVAVWGRMELVEAD